jgi:hypothetical protein
VFYNKTNVDLDLPPLEAVSRSSSSGDNIEGLLVSVQSRYFISDDSFCLKTGAHIPNRIIHCYW